LCKEDVMRPYHGLTAAMTSACLMVFAAPTFAQTKSQLRPVPLEEDVPTASAPVPVYAAAPPEPSALPEPSAPLAPPVPVAAPHSGPCPANKEGLTDGFELYYNSVSRAEAISLKFFAQADLKATDRVLIYYNIWYKDVQRENGSVAFRCGAGMALILKISKAEANMSLPFLAARAELGKNRIQYKLRTIGLSGAGVDAAIPSAAGLTKFDVGAYAKLETALDKLLAAARKTPATITFTPRIVETGAP